MPPNSSPRPARAVSVLALTGLLTLTACEADLPEQGGADGAGGFEGEGFDELDAPDPRGNQLSHEDMREVLDEHYSDARVTDTDDYYASLRDIETELQKLAVDPTDCKQYVVQSASPVPEGALIAHADTSESDEDPKEGAGEEDAGEDTGEEGAEGEADPEASASAGGFSGATVTLPFENEGSGDDEGGSDADGIEDDSDEEEEEPVEVDLPADRQATLYTFQDWRAADAYFSSEENGLDNCGSYTVTRGGIGEDDEPELETFTSVDAVEVSSEADAALGIYRESESEGSTDESVAVMLRDSSNIVVLTAPAGAELDEEEAEVAVEELEDEASTVLSDL